MSARTAAWLAWSLVCLSALGNALALLLGLSRINPVADAPPIAAGEALQYVTQLSYAVVGALIASRRPKNPIGWIFCALGILSALVSLTYEYAVYGLLTNSHSLAGAAAVGWLSQWIWAPTVGLWALSMLLFPSGELPSRRWRWVSWSVMGASALVVAPVLLMWPLRGPVLLEASGAIPGAGSLNMVVDIAVAILLASVLPPAASLIVRYRGAHGEERQQLKWLAYAAVLVLLVWTGISILEFLDVPLTVGIAGVAFALVLPAIPIAAAVAILRYRLYDIDLIIRRTLVYGALTATLAGVYLAGIVSLQAVLRAFTGQGSSLAVVATTLGIAALFQPLRRRIQRGIDHRFFRRKYDAARTLQAYSAHLRDEVDLDALTGRFVGVVEHTLQPQHVSVWLRPTHIEDRVSDPS